MVVVEGQEPMVGMKKEMFEQLYEMLGPTWHPVNVRTRW